MKWIPVSERKPPVGSNIMIWSPEGHAAEGEMNSAGEFIQYRWSTRVKATHWAEMDPGPGEQKTADQMFREMGYEREAGGDEGVKFCYVKDHGGFSEKIEVYENCFISYVEDDVEGMNFADILACAQLIREMEQENG